MRGQLSCAHATAQLDRGMASSPDSCPGAASSAPTPSGLALLCCPGYACHLNYYDPLNISVITTPSTPQLLQPSNRGLLMIWVAVNSIFSLLIFFHLPIPLPTLYFKSFLHAKLEIERGNSLNSRNSEPMGRWAKEYNKAGAMQRKENIRILEVWNSDD